MKKELIVGWYVGINLAFLICIFLSIYAIISNISVLKVFGFFGVLGLEYLTFLKTVEFYYGKREENKYKSLISIKDAEIERLKNHNKFLVSSALKRSKKYEELMRYVSKMDRDVENKK